MAADIGGRVARRRGKRRRQTVVIAGAVGAVLVVGAVAGAVALVTKKDERTNHVTQSTRVTTTSSTTSTTVPVATTVVPKSMNPVVALAQQYDGYYEGPFTNATFQTSGKATLEIRIDPNAGTLDVTADFDGDVFGGGTNGLRRIQATVKVGDPNASVSTDTKSFGKVTGRVDASLSLILSAPDVPDPNVKSFDLTGKLRDDRSGFDATYHVVFEDGKSADGTVTVTCATNGQRPSEVRTLCTPA
jgi:hypothetical protein